MPERRRLYTADEDKLILESKLPVRELAGQLNRTRGAVQRRRYELRHPGTAQQSRVAYMSKPGARDRDRRNYYAKGTQSQPVSRPWTQADEDRILADDRPTDEELSYELKRTIRAIQIRRSKLLAAEN